MASEKLPDHMSLDSSQQKTFSKKIKQLQKKPDDKFGSGNTGVCYIGHIPHGFFEPQMKKYFSQFGTVNKLRIARSKKTGKIKGYAFIEFQNDGVAQVVADTMNNYLMFHRLLKCQYLPLHKVHPETFKNSDRKFKRPKASALAVERHNCPKTEKKETRSIAKMKTRKAKSLSKLGKMGIEFEYPGVVKIEAEEGGSDGEADMSLGERSLSDIKDEALSILYDDSDEEEISFSTPPNSVRKKLDRSVIDGEEDTSEEEEEEEEEPTPKRAKPSPSAVSSPKSKGGKKGIATKKDTSSTKNTVNKAMKAKDKLKKAGKLRGKRSKKSK